MRRRPCFADVRGTVRPPAPRVRAGSRQNKGASSGETTTADDRVGAATTLLVITTSADGAWSVAKLKFIVQLPAAVAVKAPVTFYHAFGVRA